MILFFLGGHININDNDNINDNINIEVIGSGCFTLSWIFYWFSW